MVANYTDEQLKTEYPLYPYDPNTTIPLIAAGVFGVGLVYHFMVSCFRGGFSYWWAFCLGLAGETAGYIFRHLSAEKPTGTNNLGIYAASLLCIVLSPAFLAASMYATYGRIIRYVGPEYSPIKKVTGIFVCTDILSILVQTVGSIMFTSTNADTAKLAKIVLMAGFIIQLVAFSTFMITSIVFYCRCKREDVPTKTWSIALFALWAACLCILVRSVYRTLEFAIGQSKDGAQSGYILTHEWVLWAFETCLCVAATAVLALFHPSFFLPRDKHATQQALPTSTWKPNYY